MENSSKALVIAGSVLIAILLLATGVQVYDSTRKNSAEQAKQASNQMWDGVDLNLGLAGGSVEDIKRISKEESYIGYYANLDDDPEPEGIIYADLAEKKSGQWGINIYATFSYEAITTKVKDYYISDTGVTGYFGPEQRDVISVEPGSTGANRFYVMALEDFNKGTYYCWYDAAFDSGISNYSTVTSEAFGSGATNTATMIEKWNTSAYGKQNDNKTYDNKTYKDMWGEIQGEVNNGWFVPSRGEWSAFGYNLGITKSNYPTYGLSNYCWASSLSSDYRAWIALFSSVGSVNNDTLLTHNSVRLSVTF